jgi:integrase
MMIQRRAQDAGIETKISCHSFRATGITTYLQNGGKLEVAQAMAGHESARTGLYDRRNDAVELDEVEKVVYLKNYSISISSTGTIRRDGQQRRPSNPRGRVYA